MKKYIIILTIFLGISKKTYTQNYIGLLNEKTQIISAGINANPSLNANTDYFMCSKTTNNTIQKYGFLAQVNVPIFSQKGFDFDFRIGVGALLKLTEHLKAISGISWGISRTADLNGRYFHSGFKIDLLPGYFGSKWAFAPHLSLNYQPWINIKHSDYAKQAFQDLYPNNNGHFTSPKDGWFYQNNITFQAGIGIAYFQPNWQLSLIAGFQHQPNSLGLITLPDIGIMPFYGAVNFGYSITNEKGKN